MPEGWTFKGRDWGDSHTSPLHGYDAYYDNEMGYPAVIITVAHREWIPASIHAIGAGAPALGEIRTIEGYSALLHYSPEENAAGRSATTSIQIFDHASGIEYAVIGQDRDLRGSNIDKIIPIALSIMPSEKGLHRPLSSDLNFRVSSGYSYEYELLSGVPKKGSSGLRVNCGWHSTCVAGHPHGDGLDLQGSGGTSVHAVFRHISGRKLTAYSYPYVQLDRCKTVRLDVLNEDLDAVAYVKGLIYLSAHGPAPRSSGRGVKTFTSRI